MRRCNSTSIIPCIFAVFMLLAATDVRASTIIQTTETAGQTFNGAGFGGDFSQFDPSLGTLKAVTLSFSGAVSYFASFTLDPSIDPSLCGVSIDCGAEFSFSTGYLFNAPGFPLAVFPEDSDMFAIVNFSGSVDAATPDAASDPFAINFEGHPDSLAGYIGNGSILVDGLISEDSDFCGDGPFPPDNGTCQTSDYLDLLTTLTYDFAPTVAEPSSIWLFVSSVLIIVGFGARTARRTAGTSQRS